MTYTAGSRLGPYEILSPIGEGGMGQVWKARDTRLDRTVAIKTSLAQFDERFEREARAVAALNHPHICQLYDVGPNYLVMELVEGQPIKGPLPLDQALTIAIQLADALDAAHKKGITHRDLKPANALMTKSGVKVLDFGLAKFETARGVAVGGDSVTRMATQQGTIVGTLQYMAPEQLQGKDTVDSRADIFSFGCVLYEMLTGKRAFGGDDAASVIAAIMERPAPSVGDIAPAALDRVLKKCLAKDPDDRWQSARDLKDELLWIASGSGGTVEPRAERKRPSLWMAIAAASTLALAALAVIHFREKPAEREQLRFLIPPPAGQQFQDRFHITMSPDGGRLLFAASAPGGRTQLWVRNLEALDPQPIEGTEDATDGCWSPDGESIAYFAGRKLLLGNIDSGARRSLADAPDGRGCAWSPDGTILFTPNNSGPLYRVNASGGTPVAATRLSGYETHRYPSMMPGGRHFLYARTDPDGHAEVRLGSLDSPGEDRTLTEADSFAVWSGGFLLYLRGVTLMARPYDLSRNVLTGKETAVAQRVDRRISLFGSASFAASPAGRLVYLGDMAEDRLRLTWFDRSGKRTETSGDPGSIRGVHISPDGKKALVTLADASGQSHVWVQDLEHGTRTRLSRSAEGESNALWSPDGGKVVLLRGTAVMRISADGSGPEETLLNDRLNMPYSFSPDGKFLALWAALVPKTGNDIRILSDPLGPAHASTVSTLIGTELSESHPEISPDGKWIAYTTNASGSNEIVVAPFRSPGAVLQISVTGGSFPMWRRDGRELFFLDLAGSILSADVNTHNGAFDAGPPRALFPLRISSTLDHMYDISPDGRRILAAVPPEDASPEPLRVVENWTAGLKK